MLKDIYEHTKLQIDTDRVYQYLQKTNNKDYLIKKTKEYESILKDLSSQEPRWKNALTSIWNGWIQVTYTNRNDITDCSPAKPSNIKVYTNLKDYEAQAIFIESIKHLLKNASDSFAAKICSFQRNDQICYWVTPEDFKHLEEFYIPLSDKLIESMPFIAYRNKLGISKDFPGVESSHNSTMAHIISDYLKNINSIDQIDLEAMYNNYIAKWNADIYEECDYSIFKSSSVLSFIIILDTLDIILGDSYITDDSLLLYDNKDFWYKLSSSYCWADLNNQFKKES